MGMALSLAPLCVPLRIKRPKVLLVRWKNYYERMLCVEYWGHYPSRNTLPPSQANQQGDTPGADPESTDDSAVKQADYGRLPCVEYWGHHSCRDTISLQIFTELALTAGLPEQAYRQAM
jgi:hypothetical protein